MREGSDEKLVPTCNREEMLVIQVIKEPQNIPPHDFPKVSTSGFMFLSVQITQLDEWLVLSIDFPRDPYLVVVLSDHRSSRKKWQCASVST